MTVLRSKSLLLGVLTSALWHKAQAAPSGAAPSVPIPAFKLKAVQPPEPLLQSSLTNTAVELGFVKGLPMTTDFIKQKAKEPFLSSVEIADLKKVKNFDNEIESWEKFNAVISETCAQKIQDPKWGELTADNRKEDKKRIAEDFKGS